MCHLLLSIRWQFDVDAVYRGMDLLYEFWWNSKKVRLMSLTNKKKNSKAKGKNFLAIVKSHLEGDCDGCKKLRKECVIEVKTIPEELQSLLIEFANITPPEMLDGLLLLRDMWYHIDLFLGASLPNLPHYRTSPHEHVILQGYVDELLRKRLIHESMSPCAVASLLVPKKDESWCMSVDSRQINQIIVKYHFSILTFRDSLYQLDGARVFLKIDLCNRYHYIQIRLGDEWKTVSKMN